MSEQWKHPLAKRYTSPNGVYYLADEIDPEIDKLHNALAELEADIKRLKEQNDYWPMVVKVIELEQRNKELEQALKKQYNQAIRDAMKATRYYLKHQDYPTMDKDDYQQGVTIACQNIEQKLEQLLKGKSDE